MIRIEDIRSKVEAVEQGTATNGSHVELCLEASTYLRYLLDEVEARKRDAHSAERVWIERIEALQAENARLREAAKHSISEQQHRLLCALLTGINMDNINPTHRDRVNKLLDDVCNMYPLPEVKFTAEGAGRAMGAMLGGGA